MNSEVRVSPEVRNRLLSEREQCKKEVKSFLTGRRMYGIEFWTVISMIILYSIGLFGMLMTWQESEQMPPIFIPLINQEVSGSLLIIGILLLTIPIRIIALWFSRRHLRRFSRAVCLFASVSAAESLEEGSRVDAGFYTDIPWKATLKNVLREDIETLHENHGAVRQAVMNERRLSNEFSDHLYLLADELFSDKKNSDYNRALESLHYFSEKSKKYRLPLGFLGRHKRVKRTASVLAEFLKATIVPILLFVLWLVFGYK